MRYEVKKKIYPEDGTSSVHKSNCKNVSREETSGSHDTPDISLFLAANFS